MARREIAPQIVTISWRDIPAQVNGQFGRERHQIMLPARFQRAIDRAKRKARITTADEDVAQWTRTSVACAPGADLAAAAAAEADRIIGAYPVDYLGRLAYAGGFISDLADDLPEQAALRDLEELTIVPDRPGGNT